MKFLLLSDLHILFNQPVGRLDNTHKVQLKKLKFVFEHAWKEGLPIIAAGDIFDAPRSWRLLSVYIDFFKYWVLEKGISFYTVRGQHDVYMYNEETNDRTTLGVLAKMGLVTILSSVPLILDNVSIYGTSYGQEIPKINSPDTLNILVIHAPILQKRIWHGQKGHNYADEFLKEHPEFDLILCGDIHQKFLFQDGDRIICNAGCMIRKSVAQWEHEPGFYIYDTESRKIDWEVIPHDPPELVMSREHLDKVNQKNEMLEEFIATVKKRETGEGASFKDILLQVLEDNKIEAPVRKVISEVMEGR